MDKIIEFIHLQHFKEICSFFPFGEIEKSEKPDFIVHAGDKVLGVEHTEILQSKTSGGESLQPKMP